MTHCSHITCFPGVEHNMKFDWVKVPDGPPEVASVITGGSRDRACELRGPVVSHEVTQFSLVRSED
jgi:hypothetical protein